MRPSRLATGEGVDPFDPRYLDFSPPAERRIHATNLAFSFLVDEHCYPELVRHSWNAFVTPYQKIYARRGGGSRGRRTILLHREVLLLHGLEPPDDGQRWCADHVDGEELDCRGSNLRWATYRENRMNRRVTPSCAIKDEICRAAPFLVGKLTEAVV